MKRTLTYLLIICAFSAYSQEMTYTIKSENTDIKLVNAKLSFWDILVSSSRMTFAGGIGGKVYLNGLYVGGNYDIHYLDDLGEAVSSDNIVRGSSIYQPTRSKNGDVTLGYFLQRETTGKVRVNLKQQGKTLVYTKVEAKYNRIFGLQVNYKTGFSHMTIPAGVEVKDKYFPELGHIKTDYGMTTFMKYKWISFGPSIGKIVDIVADFDELGERKVKFFERIYGNVIFATKSELEDVYYTEGFGSSNPMVHQYVLDGNVAMSNLGFNIGYETFKLRGVGVGYGIEIGVMPGVKVKGAGNGYFLVKWGLVFGKGFGIKS
ncbi:MAG: hypothetical protein HXX09_12590 [Bacteroidetes bacterium]|nr:hypothetical protein [Bacteroidota bacterium]